MLIILLCCYYYLLYYNSAINKINLIIVFNPMDHKFENFLGGTNVVLLRPKRRNDIHLLYF